MESGSADEEHGRQLPKISGNMKLFFAVLLVIVAGIIGYMQLFRTHPAQSTVKKSFELVEEGDIEGIMENVDPEGQLGALWNENKDGVRDKLLLLMDSYRLDFDSLKFNTRVEGDVAEVELKGGRVTVYSRGQDGLPSAFLDLGGSDLIFELEKKGDRWLIEGINYDISQFLSGDRIFSPF